MFLDDRANVNEQKQNLVNANNQERREMGFEEVTHWQTLSPLEGEYSKDVDSLQS